MTIFPITQVPITIPGCFGWMDPADVGSITSSGGAVSVLRNKANSQIQFIQPLGSAQPTTGARTINGLNVLDLNGTTHFITAHGLSDYFSGTDIPHTIFYVAECDAPTSASPKTVWGLGRSSSDTPFHYQHYINSLLRVHRKDDANSNAEEITAYTAGVNVNCLVFTGTTVSNYVNSTTSYSGTAFNLGSTTLDRFTIGGLTRSSTILLFDGAIGEIIMFNRALPDSERIYIQRYLCNKWGQLAP